MPTSFLRGHPIVFENGEWLYTDTKKPTFGNERQCGSCGLVITKEGHDGCLGVLPGVMNACCGHGVEEEAYIQFNKERCIDGPDAIKEIARLKNILTIK